MTKALRSAILCAGVVAACGSPTAPERPLESYIQQFTGPGAVNCGRLARTASDQDMETALACALDAARRGASFSVVRQYQGVDSAPAEGLLARTAGTVFKFFYDSAPCGNDRLCGGSFRTEPCAAPRLDQRGSLTIFACGP